MSKSVSQKMEVRDGTRAFFVNAPQSALASINLPTLDIVLDLDFDYIHPFTTSQAELDITFLHSGPTLKPRVRSRYRGRRPSRGALISPCARHLFRLQPWAHGKHRPQCGFHVVGV